MKKIMPQLAPLLLREWYILCAHMYDTLGDGITVSVLHFVALKFFLPAMGMESTWQVPLFLGNLIALCFTVGYLRGFFLTSDIATNQFTQYQLTLPGGGWRVIGAYMWGIALHMLFLIVPVGIIGVSLLAQSIVFHGSIPVTLVMLILIVLFFSTFFLMLGFLLTPEGYMDHAWPRFLGPMFVLGALFFTWYRIATVSPRLALLFLVSPVTYCAEGLRGAVLGSAQYLSTPLCMGMLSIFICVQTVVIMWAVRRRLDLPMGWICR